MGTTPVYALPFQGLTDPPNGPTLGEDLALAVEAELARIDAVDASQNTLIAAPDAAWVSPWTPTWGASAGSPAIGNGTFTGRYRRQGKTYDLEWILTGGGTTNYGTAGAYWQFDISNLPGWTAAAASYLGIVAAEDAAVLEYGGYCRLLTGGDIVELFKPVSGRWTNTSPFTFGTNDYQIVQITVEST